MSHPHIMILIGAGHMHLHATARADRWSSAVRNFRWSNRMNSCTQAKPTKPLSPALEAAELSVRLEWPFRVVAAESGIEAPSHPESFIEKAGASGFLHLSEIPSDWPQTTRVAAEDVQP